MHKAADIIRQECNEKNEELRRAGYSACGPNECLEQYINVRGGKNFGALQLKLGRNEFNGDPFVMLSFTYSERQMQNTPSRILECYDPSAKVRMLVEDEMATWSFARLAEFCAQ